MSEYFYGPVNFTGEISRNDEIMPINFTMHVMWDGGICLNIDDIAINDKSKFLLFSIGSQVGTPMKTYVLRGKSNIGEDILIEDAFISEISHGELLKIKVECQRCAVYIDNRTSIEDCAVIYHLKGFYGFDCLTGNTDVGSVRLSGQHDKKGNNIISGNMVIAKGEIVYDINDWIQLCGDLNNHILRVMSFALSTNINVSAKSIYYGDKLRIHFMGKSDIRLGILEPFSFLHLSEIFLTAISSFRSADKKVKNLWAALEWYLMSNTYNELRILTAAIAIENLIHHNLSNKEVSILSKKKFSIISSGLKDLITKNKNILFDEISQSEYSSHIYDYKVDLIYKNTPELNKIVTVKKVKIFLQKFDVPTVGLDDEKIQKILSARNKIVHRGVYYSSDSADEEDLWSIVLISRELLTRIFLSIYGFKGNYMSYYDGHHQRKFPECTSIQKY